jgi:hypothetical protein
MALTNAVTDGPSADRGVRDLCVGPKEGEIQISPLFRISNGTSAEISTAKVRESP